MGSQDSLSTAWGRAAEAGGSPCKELERGAGAIEPGAINSAGQTPPCRPFRFRGTNRVAGHYTGSRPPIPPSPCSAGYLGRSRHESATPLSFSLDGTDVWTPKVT